MILFNKEKRSSKVQNSYILECDRNGCPPLHSTCHITDTTHIPLAAEPTDPLSTPKPPLSSAYALGDSDGPKNVLTSCLLNMDNYLTRSRDCVDFAIISSYYFDNING